METHNNNINQSNKWFVVVNPNAGNRKIDRDWKRIHKLLGASGLEFDFAFTEHANHAVEITQHAIRKGFRRFIAVGGDGTYNEMVNGIFKQQEVDTQEFITAVIPVGTGNDWGRMYEIPADYRKAIQVIKNERVFVQDIGKISYFEDGKMDFRYFINIAGIGFDALVAQKTNRQKAAGKGNALSYFYNLFAGLLEFKPAVTDIFVDDKTYSFNTFSISVGICRYNGGGMKQLPNAIPDDGLLDMTVIKKIGLGTVFAQLRNLYTGSFVKHPKVATFRGHVIRIRCRRKGFMMEADGESLGESPFEVNVVPRALKMIINKKP
jgi:YegS/Rv2252/BmrU family lipid kinase